MKLLPKGTMLKKRFLALSLTLTMTVSLATAMTPNVKALENDPTVIERALIPKPLNYEVTEGKFILTENTTIYVEGNSEEETNEIYRTGQYLSNKFKVPTGYSFNVVKGGNKPVGSITLTTVGGEETLGDEGYNINVTADGVEVVAYKPEGLFRAAQTLRQLLPADIEKSNLVTGVEWSMPYTEINDKPEYGYRGTMLDVARHFRTVDEVKRQIDLASQYKINKFHIHLTDDQGWRLEIKKWPDLALIGGSTEVGGGPGGYYTQEEFKEIVEYANERYVEIIPEFDMPGHTNAALASYGFLNPDGQKKPLYTGIDVGFSSFMCRDEATYEFIEDVIAEVSAISPSQYIHIGGDEAHSTSKEDYDYFIGRVTEIVESYGKTVIGWDPSDTPADASSKSVLQNWSGSNTSAVEKGMPVLVSKASKAYLDMKYDRNSPYGLSWAGLIPIKTGYEWDPTDFAPKDSILGVEAPLWAETLVSLEAVDYLTFPRLAGYAEIGWTPKEMRSWNEYKPRLIAHGERLENQGVKYYKDPNVWEVPYVPVNAEWNLDEGEGTTINDTNNKYPGTLHGGASWIEGKQGNGISLDGSGYVDLGINDLKGDWTAALWVNKGSNTGTNAALIGGIQGEIKLEQWKDTKKVGITEFGVADYTFNYIAPEGQWVHLSFVGDDTGTALYVNGQLQDKISAKISGPAKRIGANAKAGLADSGNMVGSVDEVKIFNRALTAEEIDQIVNPPVEPEKEVEFKVTAPTEEITVGGNFNVTVGIENLETENMYAMQFDTAYDSEKVDFVGATSPDDSKYIVTAKDNNGTIKVVVATKGNAIENAVDVVNLQFTAKASGENIEFNMTNGVIADGEGNIVEVQDKATTVNIKEDIINPNPDVDKTALRITIDYANELVVNGALEGVVPAVAKEFNEALTEAVEVYENADATEGDVDAAFKRLVNAIWMLEFKQGNKEALQALVDSAKALVEKEYTAESWTNLQTVLVASEAVLADENAMQEEVDEAFNNLKDAIDALVKNNVNKAALENLVNKVSGLDNSKYLANTWKSFEDALNAANAVLANESATQEEVDTAYNNLLRAYLNLRLIPDKSALEDLINKVEKMDLSVYTRSSVDQLNRTIKEAKAVLSDNNATQEEVDVATKNVDLALANLQLKSNSNNSGNNNNSSGNGNSNSATKPGNGGKLPNTGAAASSAMMLLLGAATIVTGRVVSKKKKEDK